MPGDPARPLSRADVENKFKAFTAGVTSDAPVLFLHCGLAALESRASLTSLMQTIERIAAKAASAPH